MKLSSTLINPPHVFVVVILVMPFASLQNCADIIWGSWRLTPPATQLFVNISFLAFTHIHTQTLIWCMHSLYRFAWQLLNCWRRNTHNKEVLPYVIRGHQQVTSKLWRFYTPIWKKRSYYVVAMSLHASEFSRLFSTFVDILGWNLEYTFSISDTTCRVWVSSQSRHFDLLYSLK